MNCSRLAQLIVVQILFRCVIAELKRLGDDFSGTVIAARRLNIAKSVIYSLALTDSPIESQRQ